MHPPVVLIVLDGSPEAEYALPQAEAAARAHGHSLRLLGIVDATPPAGTKAPPASFNFPLLQRRIALEDYLHRMARALQQRGTMAEVLVLCETLETALVTAVAAAEVVLTVIAQRPAMAGVPAADLERLLAGAAGGSVQIVQLQPA